MWSRSAWARVRCVWGGLTLNLRLIVVAVVALVGVLASVGWFGGGARQLALAVAAVALVAAPLTIIGHAEPRHQIDDSHRRSVELNDMVLRRVGGELHDGPAQLISLALLRLDSLRPQGTASNCAASIDDFERIRSALEDALGEIRCISAGLTLPELGCVSASDVLRLAVRNHERRTATSVTCEVEGLPHHVPAPIKSCLYRFAQEALNNAYHHAGGRGQTVRAGVRSDMIEVEVGDSGPGFEPNSKIAGNRLGLLGMRERVASLGGTLEINSRPGAGTRLTTRLKMVECSDSQR
jgi:signal transduction histidine kinase